MGSLFSAECECGYTARSLHTGVGMLSGSGMELGPCLCRECREVVTANIHDDDPQCPRCRSRDMRFYFQTPTRRNDAAVFRDVEQTDRKFECPACGQQSLLFTRTGLWD
jgi:ribosomal protein L37AE/L43A